MYQYELKIPIERIAILVGKKGDIKRKIQNSLDIKIKINSKEGEILISGEDNLNLMIAQNIIKAIGRGFNPKIALQLLNDDYNFELMDISDYCKSKKDLIRIRGRTIGENGKCRKFISKMTGVDICIFGKTIGLIGKYETVSLVKWAYDKLLKGSSHGKVFNFIQKEFKKLKIGL